MKKMLASFGSILISAQAVEATLFEAAS